MKNHSLTKPQHLTARKVLLVLGIIFVAFNLRPAITSVGPLIGWIRADLGLSNGVAGFITTLPLVAFAFLSLLAPRFAHRWGNELTVFFGLIVLIVGIVIRSTGTIIGLFLGTALVGIGIAISNVLLPGIVKQKFPEKVGLMTSVYSTSMGTFAALASGVSIPLAQGLNLGWKNSLAFWAVFAVLAVLIWIPQLRGHDKPASNQSAQLATSNDSLWRSPLAWQVTFFMGLQSFLFYCTVAWLPAILQSRGMSEEMAGWMLSIMQFISLPATFITPVLADRQQNQKGIAFIIGVIQFVGTLGLFAHRTAILITSIVLIGIALGASISLALSLLGLRTANASQAARLSGMAQSIGYFLAAIGPILIGFLFDQTHSWVLSLFLLLLATIFMIFTGIGAGRSEYVLPSKK
jgi:MFS transporter, CP family, cyanate transporter